MSEEWLDEVSPVDFPENQRALVEQIGIKAAVALTKWIGGTYYYVPKTDKLLSCIRNKKIREEFNGCNHKELARKYDLSETSIRRIVEGQSNADQTSLFPLEG